MAKKTKDKAAAKAAVPAGEAGTEIPARKRSKLKLALFVLLPLLLLGGGGYAGWVFFLAPAEPAHAAAEGEHGGEHGAEAGADGHDAPGIDAEHVAALAAEAAAETSYTYSFALSELLDGRCGAISVPKLQEASDTEAKADGLLVSRSWQAALRRIGTITEKSCDMIVSEIRSADLKAGNSAAAAEEAAKKAEGGGGH